MSYLRSEQKLNQKILFNGMEYNVNGHYIRPLSDIDAISDCCGHAWIIYESKFDNALPPIGQKILLENMIRDLSRSGKPAIAVICSHEIKDPAKDIYLANSIVTAYYMPLSGWKYKDKDYMTPYTAKSFTELFLKRYAPDMLKAPGNKKGFSR